MCDSSQHQDSIAYVRDELAALEAGIAFTWARTSRLLKAIDHTGYWRDQSTSFTQWVNSHAAMFGARPSSLWHYIAAGRYYQAFRCGYPEVCTLPLGDLPAQVSPENLESIYKLSRVAPAETIASLLGRVLNSTVKRDELRAAWTAYRPILKGRTARGRGVEPPKFNGRDGDTEQAALALVTHGLISATPEWTGIDDIQIYKLFHAKARNSLAGLDAVAVTRGKRSRLLLHGIEITSRLSPAKTASLKSLAETCDLLWVAMSEQPQEKLLDKLPGQIGVIVVDTSGIRIVRPARLAKDQRDTGELAKILLEQELAS